MLVVNFKTYPNILGDKGVEFARMVQEVSGEYGSVKVGVAPPAINLTKVAQSCTLQVWAQHAEALELGKTTGFLPAQALKEAGSFGTFLNHSEHPLQERYLRECVQAARQAGLSVMIFAQDEQRVSRFVELSPNFITYESPELIGGKLSVTDAKPDIIEKAVQVSGNVPLLVGAGVHEGRDIKTALRLGAVGVVLSSGVVLADNPGEVLRELLEAF